jgi:hypothetical protein
MAWQKDQRLPVEGAKQQLVRRLPKGAFDGSPLDIGQTFDVIDPTAANDADYRL